MKKNTDKYKEMVENLTKQAQEIIPKMIDKTIEDKDLIHKIEVDMELKANFTIRRLTYEFSWFAIVGRLQCLIYRIPSMSEKGGWFKRKENAHYIELLENHEKILITKDTFKEFFIKSKKYDEIKRHLEEKGCKVAIVSDKYNCLIEIEW